jgi:hypothetical protein
VRPIISVSRALMQNKQFKNELFNVYTSRILGLIPFGGKNKAKTGLKHVILPCYQKKPLGKIHSKVTSPSAFRWRSARFAEPQLVLVLVPGAQQENQQDE